MLALTFSAFDPTRKSLESRCQARYRRHRHGSKISTVVGPVKESLSLAFAAALVAGLAVKFDLPNVSSHCLPAPDLSKVFLRRTAAQIISTILLKPAARIVGVYPSVLAPNGQWLAGIDAEIVQ